MKIEIEFNNKTKSEIKKKFLFEVVKKTLSHKEVSFAEDKIFSISFAAVSKDEIAEINRIYRKKPEVTDVLSFSEYRTKKELSETGDNEVYLGEIIVCYNYIKEYVSKEKKDFKKELTKIISHGLLHLLNFKHSKKMFRIQEEVGSNPMEYGNQSR
jgi:rRNA maturation RNase YbeY